VRATPGPVIEVIIESWLAVARAHQWRLRCSHVTESPMPVFGRAHHPGVVLCGPCLFAVSLSEEDSPEDYTCDACREHVPSGVHDAVTVIGSITLLMGLCTACARRNAS
jgi:hypothetical protein